MSVAGSAVVESSCAYPFASALSVVRGRPWLALATSSAPAAQRLFFAGRLVKPEIAAQLLLATSEVALTMSLPPRLRAYCAVDPVVTAADGRLRLESFSQCCGAYARADLLPDMLSADVFGKGTTNVDFNPPGGPRSRRCGPARLSKADCRDIRTGQGRSREWAAQSPSSRQSASGGA